MISHKHYSRRHHLDANQSSLSLATRQRRAAFVRETTQLLHWQNTKVTIKGVEYTLDRLVGHGGQGAVYESTAPNGEKFAIKLFVWEESTLTKNRLKHPSAESFLKELALMLRLAPISQHFVTFHAVDVSKKVPGLVLGFIIMELGDGDLGEMIKTMASRKLTGNTYIHGQDRKFVWRQIVACVRALHERNIVNTDLKPGNFITFGNKIKLSDLGIAHEVNKSKQHYPGNIGTPHWSAPEVMDPKLYSPRGNQVSRKADIWSLGAILYYMTYGTTPTPTTVDQYHHTHASAPPAGKEIARDPHLQHILYLTLQMNPANRPNIIQLQQHPYTLSFT